VHGHNIHRHINEPTDVPLKQTPECHITLLNHNRKNPIMYEHKRKNQKKIDYCIVNGTYFAGTKEEKKYNHWTYLLNTVKHSLENEDNFKEFFNKLEKVYI